MRLKPSQDQAMADPTADRRPPTTSRSRSGQGQTRHKNISLTLATVADCRRKQGDGTVGLGTRAVVS